jgi:hypothetical protein
MVTEWFSSANDKAGGAVFLAILSHNLSRNNLVEPFHSLFSHGFFKGGLELGAFPRQSVAFHAAQLLANCFLNGLTATFEDALTHQPIQFTNEFFVQGNSYSFFTHVHSPIDITFYHTYGPAGKLFFVRGGISHA